MKVKRGLQLRVSQAALLFFLFGTVEKVSYHANTEIAA